MVNWPSDDLAAVLVAPDREHVGYAQGILRAWDPDTFSNVVSVRGGDLHNLPVAAGVEALTYQAGDVLMLTRWKLRSGKGSATYWIGNGGRVVFPGAGRAEESIAFMRGSLAKQISHEVFAARVHAAEVIASGATDSETYTAELTVSGGGPSIAGVEVSATGIALVGVQAQISIIASPSQTNQAYISYRVTGATSRSAVDSNAKRTDIGDTDAASITNVTDQSMSWSIQTGLNAGIHTFETMYRTDTAFALQAFQQRRIIVIAY